MACKSVLLVAVLACSAAFLASAQQIIEGDGLYPEDGPVKTTLGSQFGAGYTWFGSKLDGEQNVPPSNSRKIGNVVCAYRRNQFPYYLECGVGTNNDANSVTLHIARSGLDGPQIASFSRTGGDNTLWQTSLDLTNLESTLQQDVVKIEQRLLDGEFYVLASAGDDNTIRGQIKQDSQFLATVNTDQIPCINFADDDNNDDNDRECDDDFDPDFSLRGLGIFNLNAETRLMNYTIIHDDNEEIIQSGIRIAPPGFYGEKSIVFEKSHSPIVEENTLFEDDDGNDDDDDDDFGQATVKDLWRENLAVQIKDKDAIFGRARGQIYRASYPPVITHYAELNDANGVNTDASGIALFAYNCLTRHLEWYVHHSVNDPLSVKLYRSGNKEFTLNSGRVDEGVSPIFGVKRLTEEQERALVDGGLTIVVTSRNQRSFPGEINGVIEASTRDNPVLGAFITGAQAHPPQTVHNTGVALAWLDDDDNKLRYRIQVDTPFSDLRDITLNTGYPGTEGVKLFGITESNKVSFQGVHYVEEDVTDEIENDRLFINVFTKFFFLPQMRGQVTELLASQCTIDPNASAPRFLGDDDDDDDDDN